MTHRLVASFVLAGALLAAGCDQRGAYGDTDSIILATSPDLWAEIQDSVLAALEPRVFTVRQEQTFQVTFQDPGHSDWGNLRQFKQELLIGRATDPWMTEAVAQLDPDELDPPQLLQTYNVWARGQNVTIMLLSPTGGADEVLGLLDELHELFDRQFREYAQARMFTTGPDSALADTLRAEAGFSLIVPEVYYWDRQNGVYIFRNDNPDPSELIRQITVTWRTPASQELDTEELLSWRADVAAAYFGTPQDVDLGFVEETTGQLDGKDMLQVQAVWENPPELDWPAGGPFITRAIRCSGDDRLFLIDAWLYAPGKAKYEYMIQLETILDSFRCDLGAT